jgi:hypothetical protein
LGGTPANPLTTAGEENVLCLQEDRWAGESILVHEVAHAIHLLGANSLAEGFDARLLQAYEAAMAGGLWADTYAATNHVEYWAEGVQSWFDSNQNFQAGIHNQINTRSELLAYDPDLAALIAEFLGTGDWRPTCP